MEEEIKDLLLAALALFWMWRSHHWEKRCEIAEAKEQLHQQYNRMRGR